MRLLILSGVLLLSLLGANGVLANPNERNYKVEILVFAQEPGDGTTEIPGPAKVFTPVTSPALLLGKTPAWKELISSGTKIFNSKDLNPELTRQAAALEKNSNYRLLVHQAWDMHIVGADRSVPILIEGGDYYGKTPELQGILYLNVARYLHLETDLFLHNFNKLNAENPDLDINTPNFNSEEVSDLSTNHAGNFQIKSSAGMHQKRRMRSSELHFIDSPYLGLLIRIDRI